MARHVRLALVALVCGCVNLTPPEGVSVQDARPEPTDGGIGDATAPDVPDDPDSSEPPDGGAEPDVPAGDGPANQPDATPPDTGPLLLIDGAACTGPGQCQSGVCTEGVCCDRACGVTCWSCKVTGSVGACSPTTGVTCAAARCAGSTETPVSTCSSAGACVTPASRSCGAYQCAGTTCGSSCASGAQCTAGNSCFAGGCVAQASLPALYWSFDEASGSTAADGTGNGNNGLYTGVGGLPTPTTDTPPLTFTDPRSRAFDLDARNGVALLGPSNTLKPANNLTLSVWYKATRVDPERTSDPGSDIVSAGDNYMLRLTSDGPLFVKRTASTFDRCLATVAGPLDGRWHHVAALTSSSGMKVYFDGVERCSNALGDSIAYTAGPDIWVGRHGDGDTNRDFDGQIDDVRIYTRVLTATEVADLAAGRR